MSKNTTSEVQQGPATALPVEIRTAKKKEDSLGVYFHWPYCETICPYCDFNVYRWRPSSGAQTALEENELVSYLIKELNFFLSLQDSRPVTSLYFGGGTPSLMSPMSVERLINAVTKHTSVAEQVEVTLEANPTQAEKNRFEGYRQAGVNRLSLGVQSFDDQALHDLGRWHSVREAKDALDCAFDLFPSVTFDLIYGRHQQSLKDWEVELDQALRYGPTHLSLYQLTIEQGTAYQKKMQRGGLKLPTGDHSADFYRSTEEKLATEGLFAYEVSNYAKGNARSRHNMTYWQHEPYLGIGPGAHGRITQQGQRYAYEQIRKPQEWAEKVDRLGHGSMREQALSDEESFTEKLLLGLRLREGVLVSGQEQSFLSKEKLDILQKEGDLVSSRVKEESQRLSLTDQGRLRLDSVLGFLLA